MRKAFCLFLAFTLIFSVCGCERDDGDDRGRKAKRSTGFITEVSDETAATSKEFSLGKIKGNVYTSEFIGLGCKLETGWTFYDERQIKELNNLAIDLAGEEVADALKGASMIYDMYAVDSDGLNNININLERIDKQQLISLNLAENFKRVAPLVVRAYENMGYTDVEYTIGTATVDGKTVDAIHFTANINGVNIYVTLFQKKCNGFLASITVGTYYENTVSEILDTFYWLDS